MYVDAFRKRDEGFFVAINTSRPPLKSLRARSHWFIPSGKRNTTMSQASQVQARYCASHDRVRPSQDNQAEFQVDTIRSSHSSDQVALECVKMKTRPRARVGRNGYWIKFKTKMNVNATTAMTTLGLGSTQENQRPCRLLVSGERAGTVRETRVTERSNKSSLRNNFSRHERHSTVDGRI